MIKFYFLIIFTCTLYGLVVTNKTDSEENVYYKHTKTTAGISNKFSSKEKPTIVMEGQPPFESMKFNSAKMNSVREIVKSEGKTVPRKGVSNNLSIKVDENDTLNSSSEKSVFKKLSNMSYTTYDNKTILTNLSKISTTTEKLPVVHVAPVREVVENQESNNITVLSKTVRKPKPKPEVTVGGKEADEPIPASPTNKSPLGMPRKIDYIVPVIITITALPLLGVAFYVLYKRGRDYWDKRHYRRMDFLIDGMYNE